MNDKEKLGVMNQMRLLFMRGQRAKDVFTSAIATQKGKLGGKRYICKKCIKVFPQKDVQVDHIVPIVSPGFHKINIGLDTYAHRVFCEERNLQVLCKPCHHKKTLKENAKR